VHNKRTHHVLGNKTLDEMFTGEKKNRGQPLENIWLSSVCTCSQGQEIEVGSLRKEGHICWIH
jgi:hypothetical protein